jgi:hypothetical protein
MVTANNHHLPLLHARYMPEMAHQASDSTLTALRLKGLYPPSHAVDNGMR